MKRWNGKDFEYRGYKIKKNKRDGYLEVYDKRDNYILRVENYSHGAANDVKFKIDCLIKDYGE